MDHAEQQDNLIDGKPQSPIDEDPWGMIMILVPVAGAIAWIALAIFCPGGLN